MKLLRHRLRYYFILGSFVLVGLSFLSLGRDLTNPYHFAQEKAEAAQSYGSWAGSLLEATRSTGAFGLYQYLQGNSLIHISQARLELLDRAIQGQTQYVEVLRLQLAMQNMRSDFLEKDLAVAQEEMAALQSDPTRTRLPASR